jgi:hypothetical protein
LTTSLLEEVVVVDTGKQAVVVLVGFALALGFL